MAEHSTTASTHAPGAPEHAEQTAFGLDAPAWIALSDKLAARKPVQR